MRPFGEGFGVPGTVPSSSCLRSVGGKHGGLRPPAGSQLPPSLTGRLLHLLSPVSPTAPGTATCPREAAAPGRHGPRRPRPPPAPSRLARCREPRAHLLCSGGLRALSPPRRQEEELRCGRSWDGKPGTPSSVPSVTRAKRSVSWEPTPSPKASRLRGDHAPPGHSHHPAHRGGDHVSLRVFPSQLPPQLNPAPGAP